MAKSPARRISVDLRCLCGATRHRVHGVQTGIVHCHCRRCRKFHGATFASFVAFEDAEFENGSAVSHVLSYLGDSERMPRAFCGICGSAVPHPDHESGALGFMPAAGSATGLAPPELEYRFYLASRAPWYVVPEATPYCFDAVHPEWRDPGLSELERDVPEGSIAGSCLCGDVSFEAEMPALFMMNCHCSRCRLSRAAAYATNLFVAAGGFRWIRGSDQLQSYKLPGARRFGTAFCRRCGALLPRLAGAERDRYNIPAGCLDGDPAVTPRGHIYVGSKAGWYEIDDDLPQWSDAAS